jgi:hypothetical protein
LSAHESHMGILNWSGCVDCTPQQFKWTGWGGCWAFRDVKKKISWHLNMHLYLKRTNLEHAS